MPEIEFGRLEDARQIRNDPEVRGFLRSVDDGRSSTVRLKEGTPSSVVSRVRGEAADSRRGDRERAGQAELSDQERKEIDFAQEGVNVPQARSIKGIAANEGVDDWMAYADLSLTVDENRSLLKRAKRQERGQRLDAATEENKMIEREAQAYERQRREELPRAKDAALSLEIDEDAREFVGERVEVGEFDVSFSRRETDAGETLAGSGQDYERLADAHQERSERARTVDEKHSAPITRDPLEWAAKGGPGVDYPGIDTVDPAELHAERPAENREQDEDELATIADTKQEWAHHPDRYDWPGVDTPPGYRAQVPTDEAIAGTAVAMIDARERSLDDVVDPRAVALAEEPTDRLARRREVRGGVVVADPNVDDEFEAAGISADAVLEDDVDDALTTSDQQSLAGGRADDQAMFDVDVGESDPETFDDVEENAGGLLEDERSAVDEFADPEETEQSIPDAFQVREGGQDSLF